MESSQSERIKQRDRWACKRCGSKFEDLVILQLDYRDKTDDGMITVCKECLRWAENNQEEALALFYKLLTKNKIVLVGDCHGRMDRLDEVLTAEEPFDFFLSVGDVLSDDPLPEEGWDIVNKWKHKGYAVRGNHDNMETFTPLELSQDISGVHVAGLNGILKTRNFLKDTEANISFREILYLSHLSNVEILVTHQLPTNIFRGMGEPVLEELLNYLVPKMYIFGHVHRYKLKFHLNTFVISLPMITKGHAIAHFQGKDLRNVEIVLKKGKRFIRV